MDSNLFIEISQKEWEALTKFIGERKSSIKSRKIFLVGFHDFLSEKLQQNGNVCLFCLFI